MVCAGGADERWVAAHMGARATLQAKFMSVADECGKTIPPARDVGVPLGVIMATPQCPLASLLGPERPRSSAAGALFDSASRPRVAQPRMLWKTNQKWVT